MPGLGRVTPPDWEHVSKYPMLRKLERLSPLPPDAKKEYHVPVLYDQGQTQMCVGYSASGFMSAVEEPEFNTAITFDAADIYQWANANDGISETHEGSTVRAGFEFLANSGAKSTGEWIPTEPIDQRHKIKQYLWAKNVHEVLHYLYTTSPVVIGINWYADMMNPDQNGFLSVSGDIDGGHAILVRALDLVGGFVTLRNSWGSWGFNGTGDAYLKIEDLDRLLKEDGEATAAIDYIEIPTISAP